MCRAFFCGDVCPRDKGKGFRRNGSEIRANNDYKSMRYGNSRRIFSVVFVDSYIYVVIILRFAVFLYADNFGFSLQFRRVSRKIRAILACTVQLK